MLFLNQMSTKQKVFGVEEKDGYTTKTTTT